jgi:hypothetical protein
MKGLSCLLIPVQAFCALVSWWSSLRPSRLRGLIFGRPLDGFPFDKDRAFEWLEKAYWERSSMLVHINWDPRFIGLQSDARFQDLTKRIGFPSSPKTLSRASIPTSRIAPLS